MGVGTGCAAVATAVGVGGFVGAGDGAGVADGVSVGEEVGVGDGDGVGVDVAAGVSVGVQVGVDVAGWVAVGTAVSRATGAAGMVCVVGSPGTAGEPQAARVTHTNRSINVEHAVLFTGNLRDMTDRITPGAPGTF